MTTTSVLGIDAGNNTVKVFGRLGAKRFLSDIGEYRERNLTDSHGRDDIIWEYEGHSLKKGFAGTLAAAESEFGGSIMGMTKAHEDAKLRVLLAIHRYYGLENPDYHNIVVAQPIDAHNEVEKEKIKNMLLGPHTITVNGLTKSFEIASVHVVCEGGIAFWCAPQAGTVRIVDVGSGTVNCATLKDKRFIDRESFTLPMGANTTKARNVQAMARSIAAYTSTKWSPDDKVLCVGGLAEEILSYIQNFYPSAATIAPHVEQEGGKRAVLHPVFANAVGCYYIAERLGG